MWTVLGFATFTLLLFQAIYFARQLTFPAGDQIAISGFILLLLAALMFAAMRGGFSATQTAC